MSMEDRAGAWDVRCDEEGVESALRYSVWAVFDGHGSAAVSSYLHSALLPRLRHHLCNTPLAEPAAAAATAAGATAAGPAAPVSAAGAGADSVTAGPAERPEAAGEQGLGPKGSFRSGQHAQRQHLNRRTERQQPGGQHVRTALLLAFRDLDADLQQREATLAPPTAASSYAAGVAAASGLDGAEGAAAAAGAIIGGDGSSSSSDSSGVGSGGGSNTDSHVGGGSGLEALRAAAAAAAWESGSTAVVAVLEWRPGSDPDSAGVDGSGCAGDGSGSAGTLQDARGASSKCKPAGVACESTMDGCGGSACANGVGAGAGDGSAATAVPEGAPLGALWVASVGNSPALLCLPASDGAAAGPEQPLAYSVAADGGEGAAQGARKGGSSGDRDVGDTAGRSGRGGRGVAGIGNAGRGGGRGGAAGLPPAAVRLLVDSHELDNEEERRRVEAAGGRVEEPARPGGKGRLMGDLEVSRAFGDLQYRPVGLSALPDIKGPWLLFPTPPEGPGAGGRGACDGCCSGGDGDIDGNHACRGAGSQHHSGTDSGGAQHADGSQAHHHLPARESLLLLVSDGLLESLKPQDLCNHAVAQLTGSAHPALTAPPPPAIPLGPVAEGAGASGQSEEPREAEEALLELNPASVAACPGAPPPAGGVREQDGLPGCCDCSVGPAAVSCAQGEPQHPCATQALSRPGHRRPAQRNVAAAAVRLVQEAVNRGSMDNVAAVVVQLPLGDIVLRGPAESVPVGTKHSAAATPAAVGSTTTAGGIIATIAAGSACTSAIEEVDFPPAGPVLALAPSTPNMISGSVVAYDALGTESSTAVVPTAGAVASAVTGAGTASAGSTTSAALVLQAEAAVKAPVPETSLLRRCWMKRSVDTTAAAGAMSETAAAAAFEGWQQPPTPEGGAGGSGARLLDTLMSRSMSHYWSYAAAWVSRLWSAAGEGTALESGGRKGRAADGTATQPAAPPSGEIESGAGDGGCLGPSHDTDSSVATPVTVVLVCPPDVVSEADGQAAGEGGGPPGEGEGEGYGYMLTEQITAVPSLPYHLHAPTPGGDALPPWQLSDFSGAATFALPGLAGGGTSIWLLDRLHSYYSVQPFEAFEAAAEASGEALITSGLHQIAGPHPGALLGGDGCADMPKGGFESSGSGPGGNTCSGDSGSDSGEAWDEGGAHALMAYGNTHSFLLEVASVPLELSLYEVYNSDTEGDGEYDPSGDFSSAGGGSSADGPKAFWIGGRPSVEPQDTAAIEPQAWDRQRDQSPQKNDLSEDEVAIRNMSPVHLDPSPDDVLGQAREQVPQKPAFAEGPWVTAGLAMGATLVGSSLNRRGRALMGFDHQGPESPTDDAPRESRAPSDGAAREAAAFVAASVAANDGIGRSPAAVAGPALQFQPRAHGVRQADGALHLVTSPEAMVAERSSCSSGGNGCRLRAATKDGSDGGGFGDSTGLGPLALAHVYRVQERFGQGHFGQVYRAWRLEGPSLVSPAPPPTKKEQQQTQQQEEQQQQRQQQQQAQGRPDYVLKCLRGHGGSAVLQSGLREAYFGALLRRLRDASAAAATSTVGAPDPLHDHCGNEALGAGAWDCASGYAHLVDFEESFEVVPEASESTSGAPGSGTEPVPGPTGDGSEAAYGNSAADDGVGGSARERTHASASPSPPPPDLWLVFRNAGRSLHDLLYSPVAHPSDEPHGDEAEDSATAGGGDGDAASSSATSSFQVLGPSPWWRAMRRHPRGHAFVRELLRQLLLGLQVVHEANITHRDVKPENMMLTPLPRPTPTLTPTAPERTRGSSTAPGGTDGSGDPGGTADDDARDNRLKSHPHREHYFHSGKVNRDGGYRDHNSHTEPRDQEDELLQQDDSQEEQQRQLGRTGQGQRTWQQRISAWTRRVAGSAGLDGHHHAAPPHEPQPRHGDTREEGDGTPGASASEDVGCGTGPDDPHSPNGGCGSRGGQGEAAGAQDDWAVAPVRLKLIDFGSAVDGYSLQHLYGSQGPTSDQLTLEYAPPEALFGRYWEGMRVVHPRAWAYDIWSVGVVWLELLMATPQVWQLPPATRALLEVRLALRGRPASERHLVFLLRGLMEWCIYPPQAPSAQPSGPPLRGRKSRLMMSWSCTEEALLALARSRDPLGLGLEGPMALRLLLRLLHWDPRSRPSARQALQHAYFTVRSAEWVAHACGSLAMGEHGWC